MFNLGFTFLTLLEVLSSFANLEVIWEVLCCRGKIMFIYKKLLNKINSILLLFVYLLLHN